LQSDDFIGIAIENRFHPWVKINVL